MPYISYNDYLEERVKKKGNPFVLEELENPGLAFNLMPYMPADIPNVEVKKGDGLVYWEAGNAGPMYTISRDVASCTVPSPSKQEEEESNLIRIDLDEAAKKLAALNHEDEESEGFLEAYDTYYDILFNCKS